MVKTRNLSLVTFAQENPNLSSPAMNARPDIQAKHKNKIVTGLPDDNRFIVDIQCRFYLLIILHANYSCNTTVTNYVDTDETKYQKVRSKICKHSSLFYIPTVFK